MTEENNIQGLKKKEQRRLLLLCGLGGMLEFYDFIIYALLSDVIAEKYFPSDNAWFSVLAVFSTFAAAYLTRPLGGFIFGHIGDVLGRKKTFILTILLMACATFSIGLIPTYAQIGASGAILLIVMRIIQGLSIGGEIPGAITYISECMPKRRGWATGVMFFFIANGITIGSILHWLMVSIMSPEMFDAFGWRILFFLGGAFGVINFLMRKKMRESPLFSALALHVSFPLGYVIKNKKLLTTFGFIFVGTGATFITNLFLCIPTYLKIVLHELPDDLLLVSVIACLASSGLILLFGFLSDFINKLWLMTGCSLLAAFCCIPIFYGWTSGAAWWPMLLGVFVWGGIWGVIPVFLGDLYETEVRFSGVAFCYNSGFAIFAGVGPLISLSLIKVTGNLESPAYYLVAIALIAFIFALLAMRTPGIMIPKKQPEVKIR